jgi:hypothetical protein
MLPRIFPRSAGPRVGLAIIGSEIAGVLVRRSRLVRASSVAVLDVGDALQLRRSVDHVLIALRLPPLARPCLVVALGAAQMQTRHLTHLPTVTDRVVLEKLLQTNVGRFFRKNGHALALSRPELRGAGDGWASATEVQLLDVLRATCASHGVRLKAAIPAVIAIGAATTTPSATWMENDVRVEASYTGERRLSNLRLTKRSDVPVVEPAATTLRPDLRVPATEPAMSTAIVAALGATLHSSSEPLAIRVAASDRAGRSSKRLAIAGAVQSLGLLSLAVAPLAATHQAAALARMQLRRAARSARDVRSAQDELSRTTAALDQLARFSRQRRSAVLVMESFAQALPAEASLQSLHFDESGGTIATIAPAAVEVLADLDTVPSLTAVNIVGAVAPESSSGERLERATIRFQWTPVGQSYSNVPVRYSP